MRTINVNLYSFEELKEDIKEKVIQNNYDINVEHDWWECTYNDMASVGIKVEGFDIFRYFYAEISINDMHETCNLILKWHGEKCNTYKIAKRYISRYDEINHQKSNDNEIENLNQEYKKYFSSEVLGILGREYQYLTSEKGIIETFEANEFEFLENGNVWIDSNK